MKRNRNKIRNLIRIAFLLLFFGSYIGCENQKFKNNDTLIKEFLSSYSLKELISDCYILDTINHINHSITMMAEFNKFVNSLGLKEKIKYSNLNDSIICWHRFKDQFNLKFIVPNFYEYDRFQDSIKKSKIITSMFPIEIRLLMLSDNPMYIKSLSDISFSEDKLHAVIYITRTNNNNASAAFFHFSRANCSSSKWERDTINVKIF